MLNPLEYLSVYIYGTFLVWLAFVFYHFLQTGRVKWSRYPFSVSRYYLLTIFLVLYPVYVAGMRQSAWVLWLFLAFGVAGMLFETLLSMWWRIFYEKRFYFYTVETLEHKYTSGLNFLFWGSSGFLYLGILKFFTPDAAPRAVAVVGPHLPFYWLILASLFVLLALQIIIWQTYLYHKRHDHKFQKATLGNYLFAMFPFLLPILLCAFVYGSVFLNLALWFGVIAALAEYLLGKMFQFLLTKKLWVYNFWAVDDGHFTPLALPAFAFLGFYFWAIALIVQGLIK
jgi:hypothetical protein